ncbi:MAG: butyrate kinase [Treponema sp.]|nr:butyrate kinase [Treponema sp.]
MPTTVLVINPGSTSTKIAVYEDGEELFSENVSHGNEEIAQFGTIASQHEFREGHIRLVLERRGFSLARLSAVIGRGGMLRPIPSGVYRIGESMKEDLQTARYGEHASNLGALIADEFGKELGIPAFIADPVIVDELDDVARVSGHKLFRRRSIFHALNQKAVARRWCGEHDRKYESCTLIVAHMGGGVTVGLHRDGRVVDVNNGLDGEGPFSPERSGTLPAGDLVKLCFSGSHTEAEIKKMINGKGGMVSLMGTNDLRMVEEAARIGDPEASLYLKSFVYNVAKAIGALATAASGKVDAIILTGGVAFSTTIVTLLQNMCEYIASIVVYPGEGELEALALAATRAVRGECEVREYR